MHNTDLVRPLKPARVLGACVAAILTTMPAPDAQARGSMTRLDRAERALLMEVNRTRAAHGLARYRRSVRLQRSADYHCWDMLRANFFAHASSNGTPMPSRVRRYTRAHRIGENLAYVHRRSPRSAARAIVRMWMNSPGHRAALLSGGFRRIGIARRVGSLGGGRVAVYTADFAG